MDRSSAFARAARGISRLVSPAKQSTVRRAAEGLKHRVQPKLGQIHKLLEALSWEAEVSPSLHSEAEATLKRMVDDDPDLGTAIARAYGYAVLPAVGKATALLGIGYGRGEVFEQGRVVGYAAVVQITAGLQLGGQALDEVVVFEDRDALERFKRGGVGFIANASAVIVKAGAAAARPPPGTRVFLSPAGGMMLEAALGGQRFIFKPAALDQGRAAENAGAQPGEVDIELGEASHHEEVSSEGGPEPEHEPQPAGAEQSLRAMQLRAQREVRSAALKAARDQRMAERIEKMKARLEEQQRRLEERRGGNIERGR